MKKLTIIFFSLFIVLNINLNAENIEIEKFAKLFKNKTYIGGPHDEFIIYERTGEILFNKVFYQLDGAISDNEFYFYYPAKSYNYEKDSYENITNYCVFLFTNNALMMTPYNLSVEPDYIPPLVSKNHEEAYSNYINYKDSMETLFTLVDNKVFLNKENVIENIYGTFESEDKRFSITLSEVAGGEYNFSTSSKELNKEIEEHIMMEKDLNEKGELSEYWSAEYGPSVYIGKIDYEVYGSLKNVIVFNYGYATYYYLYISVVNKDTLILLERCSPYMKNYGFNVIFKRKK